MTTSRCRRAVWLAGILSSVPGLLSAAPLFTTPTAPPWTAAAARALSAVRGSPLTAGAYRVEVAADAVDAATPRLEFRIGPAAVQARRVGGRRLGNGDVVWQGVLEDARAAGAQAGEVMTVVRAGARVTAALRHRGQLYRLIPLEDGGHVLQHVDESRLPPMHPVAGPPSPSATPALAGAVASPPPATSTIRVLAVATEQAVAGYAGDMRSLVQLALAEGNRSYAESGLDMRLELADYRVTSYRESGNMSLDLRRLQSPDDGVMDAVHAWRDHQRADVVVLVLDRGVACGEAAEIGASAATAFAVVLGDCASGSYTLAHEIGHLQGARHDIGRDPGSVPFAFGHGYWYQPPRALGWRTVMSYDCPTGCRRIPRWSSPALTHEGVPAGTPGQADNRRVLDLTRAVIAGFR